MKATIHALTYQLPKGSEIVDIASGQNYTAAGILLLVVIYLAWSRWQEAKDYKEELSSKDAQIMKVVEDHKADLKDNNKDYERLLDKYHSFTEQIRAITNAK